MQLAATGYGPGEAVPQALAKAEVAVLVAPGGRPLSATAPDGASVVPVFTSPSYLHTAGRFGYELMPVVDVLPLVPDEHVIYLNPSGPVSMTVDLGALRDAIAPAAQPAFPATEVPVYGGGVGPLRVDEPDGARVRSRQEQ